jgi:hypothetical protein
VGCNSIANFWNSQNMLNSLRPSGVAVSGGGVPAGGGWNEQRLENVMPSAADIYSQVRPVQAPADPLEQYGRMVSIKSLMGNEALNEMQRTKLGRDMQEEEAFKPVRRRDA